MGRKIREMDSDEFSKYLKGKMDSIKNEPAPYEKMDDNEIGRPKESGQYDRSKYWGPPPPETSGTLKPTNDEINIKPPSPWNSETLDSFAKQNALNDYLDNKMSGAIDEEDI